jgi:hypothetical protein
MPCHERYATPLPWQAVEYILHAFAVISEMGVVIMQQTAAARYWCNRVEHKYVQMH